MSGPRRTPLFDRHVELGGRMVNFGGWEMPQQYTTIRDEQRAVRSAAGLFDVSHMGRYQVGGPAAAEFLQGLLTNDVSRIEPGRAQYTLMCNEEGAVIDDLVVYRPDPKGYLLVVNAGNREKDMDWIDSHSRTGVTITDLSDDLALIAFQGPRAQELLPSEGVDLDAIPYFGCGPGRVAGVDGVISRTGYTGEDGFELFVPAERAVDVWDALLATAPEVLPAGLGARDVCRLEAGLRLYGNDMDETVDPYTAGLGWTVKLQKGDFVGREALSQLRQAGPGYQTVGLATQGNAIPRHEARVFQRGRRVGKVTSGTYSFWLNHGIAMAAVQVGVGRPGAELEIDVRGQTAAAEVVPLPFYRGSVKSPAASGTS